MVRYTIPASILATAIGTFGSDEAADTGKLRINKKIPVLSSDAAQELPKQNGRNADTGGIQGTYAYKKLRMGSSATARQDSTKAAKEARASEFPIQGTYAYVVTEGTYQGYAVGVVDYTGGDLSGFLTYDAGTVELGKVPASATLTGTYSLGEDGLANIGEQIYTCESCGWDYDVEVDLSVVKYEGETAIVVDGVNRIPSQLGYPGGISFFRMFQRPADGFSNASLKGTYGVSAIATGLNGLVTALRGQFTFDGEGGLEGFANINDPPLTGEIPSLLVFNNEGPDGNARAVLPSPQLGSYEIHHDGTGSFTTNNQLVTFVVFTFDIVITHVSGRDHAESFVGHTTTAAPFPGAPIQATFTFLG